MILVHCCPHCSPRRPFLPDTGREKKSKGQHDPDSFSVDGTSILQLYPNGKERNWQKMFNKDPESGVERKKSSSRRGMDELILSAMFHCLKF